MRRFILVAGILGATLGGLAVPRPALAHDVHHFGPYTVALGWLHEPAYVGADNAVQVLVKDEQGKAVTDIADKDLSVDVSLGSAVLAGKQLVPTADPDTGLGTPGELEYHFTPTAPGNYTFHVKGAIKGTPVDETVTASDKTFDEVKDPASAEFPTKVPATADIARRASVVSGRADAASQAASDAHDAANRATALGVVGIVLAVLASVGLGLAVRGGRAGTPR